MSFMNQEEILEINELSNLHLYLSFSTGIGATRVQPHVVPNIYVTSTSTQMLKLVLVAFPVLVALGWVTFNIQKPARDQWNNQFGSSNKAI